MEAPDVGPVCVGLVLVAAAAPGLEPPDDGGLADQNHKDEDALGQVDEVVDNQVLPHGLLAQDPTEDKADKLGEPGDAHDDEELADDLEVFPSSSSSSSFGASGVSTHPLGRTPGPLQVDDGQEKEDNVGDLNEQDVEVEEDKVGQGRGEETTFLTKAGPERNKKKQMKLTTTCHFLSMTLRH